MTEEKPLPKHLYKYRSWSNPLHRRMITHREIWFASPRWFNDPFDCQIPLQYRNLTHDQRVEVYKESVTNLGTPEEKSKLGPVADGWARMLSEMTDEQYDQYLGDMQRARDSQRAVFTSSTIYDDILMWSHYADSHKGFCVEFDTTNLMKTVSKYVRQRGINALLKKVEYTDTYPELLPLPDLKHRDWLRQILVKSSRWKYEDEYRLIAFDNTDFSIVLDASVITKVILGCKMADTDKEDILHTILKQDDSIVVEVATKLRGRFELKLDRLKY